MSFVNEMLEKLSVSLGENVGGYKVTLISGVGVCIEGHKGIIRIGEDNINIRINNGSVRIEGKALYLKDVTDSDVFITGSVNMIEVSRNEK